MHDRRKLSVLIIDDNPRHFGPLRTLINNDSKRFEFSAPLEAENEKEAFERLDSGPFDIIFLDIIWEDPDPNPKGIDILWNIRESDQNYKNTPVVMLTSYGKEHHQEKCLEAGCDGFMTLDEDIQPSRLASVEHILEKALRKSELRRNHLCNDGLVCAVSDPASEVYPQISLNGLSEPMRQLYKMIILIVAEPDPPNVLILGETGTGKSTVARLIHYMGRRASGPFYELVINTIPDSLVESILFGIEGRTATGVDQRTGIIEDCNGGTLFLDEIGELKPDIQVKLLRAIRERVIMRVGGKEKIKVDFKLISATNKDLTAEVRENHFRLDLFQRLSGINVITPPLQKRFEDNPKELDHLVQHEMANRRFQFSFTEDAKDILRRHRWPGNYAEFKTLIDNLSLVSTTLVDEGMLKSRLAYAFTESDGPVPDISGVMQIPDHKEAVAAFKKKHVEYWIRTTGSLKQAVEKLGIDSSTAHRILERGID